LTLVMIVVSDVVSLKERGKYQGILGGVVATANSVGPVLGGVFTEKASCESQATSLNELRLISLSLAGRWCFVRQIQKEKRHSRD